jgi:streptogramin lyase
MRRLMIIGLCVAAALAGCGQSSSGSGISTSPAPSPPASATAASPSPLPGGAELAVVVPGLNAYGPLIGEGAVWVRGIETGKLFRVDPESGELVTGTTDRGCCLAVGEGAVWAPAPEAGTLERIAPETAMVTDTFELGGLTVRAAAGGGKVWVNSHRAGSVHAVDPTTGEASSVAVGPEGPAGPQQVYFVGGDLWAGVPNLASLVRIDPATGEVLAKIALPGAGCHTAAATEQYLWLAGGCFDSPSQYNTVWKIDLATNEIASEFQPGGTFGEWSQIAFADGAVWMVTTSGLLRIDGATDEVVVVSDDVIAPGSVAADDRQLWVLSGATSQTPDGTLGRQLLRIPIP